MHKYESSFLLNPFTEELPDDWNEESDMLSFKSLDRSFVFPGSYSSLNIVMFLSFK